MKEIIEYLKKAEGVTVHRLAGEKDVTAPLGIYKHVHPKAKIFELLDVIALECGIVEDSKNWNKSDISAINKRIEDKGYFPKIEELAKEFYEEYLEAAHIEYFPKQAKLAMFSMFTHSSKNSFKAVQAAINSFVSSKHINYKGIEVDGIYGSDTNNGLIQIKLLADEIPFLGYLFEATMIFEMSRIYGQLVVRNPEKYLKYLNGWNNRLDKLLDMR
jgi:hypothetical protein